MPEKLKNMFFTRDSLEEFAAGIKQQFAKFNKDAFLQFVFDENWHQLELKARMRHTTTCLKKHCRKILKRRLKFSKRQHPLSKVLRQ